MSAFKIWLESLETEREKELRSIWADTFKALGVGGLADEDAAQQSLSKINYGQRGSGNGVNNFKGKQAARKRLENGQIFSRLEKIGDPELKQSVEDARKWLDQNEAGHEANASTTVSVLLQKMFGKLYNRFIDSDVPRMDQAKAKVPPMPPKQDTTPPDLSQGPENPQPEQPQPMNGLSPMDQQTDQQMGQPQVSPAQKNRTTNPLPPKPAGADMGMF